MRMERPAAFRISGLIVAIALVAGLLLRFVFLPGQDTTAARAADIIGISIPDSATAVSGHTEQFRTADADNHCSSVQFLLPTTDWRDYVAEFMPGPLSDTFRTSLSCTEPTQSCSDNSGIAEVNGTPTARAFEGFMVATTTEPSAAQTPKLSSSPRTAAASTSTDTAPAAFDRGVVVVPECVTGKTLVMWMQQR